MSKYFKEYKNLRIYNSLSGEKDIFIPHIQNQVRMYVCGPTVYSDVHLGNCRTFIFFDVVYRYFKHLGFKVNYIRNITDVGHLEDDADEGEDKISKRAKQEKIDPYKIAQRYTDGFHQILKKFNNLKPNEEPKATLHIQEQIEMIEQIIKRGLAYIVDGSVYFDVFEYNKKVKYGELSGRDIEQLIHNTRGTEGQRDKKNPQDFALWKKASDTHIMKWDAPWSQGFPGWHIECSAMSKKYLGGQFEIHGGGMDLKFPHHECEIAQSKAAEDTAPAKYWMHTNMLTFNGKKMSKSTGNTLLPNEIFQGESDILSKKFSPAVVRFFMMQAHYRSILDFSNDALLAAEKGYAKLFNALEDLKQIEPHSKSSAHLSIDRWRSSCYKAINNDFNTSILIAQLFEGVRMIHKIKTDKFHISKGDLQILSDTMESFVYEVLGLKDQRENNIQNITQEEILNLIQQRESARIDKNWALSDKIRNDLKTKGITLKDSENGTTFTVD